MPAPAGPAAPKRHRRRRSAGGRTAYQARPSAAIAQAVAHTVDARQAESLSTRAWSDDMNRVARVTSTPECGMVALNCVRMSGADPIRRRAAAGARARGLAPRARRAHRAEYVCNAVAEAA